MNLWAVLFGRPHRQHEPPDLPDVTLEETVEDEEDEQRRQGLQDAKQRADEAARRLHALEFEQSLYRRKRPRIPL